MTSYQKVTILKTMLLLMSICLIVTLSMVFR